MAAAGGLIFAGITSLLQFEGQRTASKVAESEAKVDAQQEELGAVQREADRKARLARALASQAASTGARGISAFEGSPLTILEEDIRTEEVATERDIFQSRLGSLTTRARGSTRSKQIRQQANIGLIKSGASIAQAT